MKFHEYFTAKAISLCAFGIIIGYLLLVFYLAGASIVLLIFFAVGALAIGSLIFAVSWYNTNKRLRTLRQQVELLPDKYLLGEVLDRPRNCIEKEYFFIMKEISRSAIGAVEQEKSEKKDYCDYVESWVHEIKTPLTACSLILANGGETRKIRRELKRADNLTDTILAYARLRTINKDIQIRKILVHEVIDQAVREEMDLLIAVGISVLVNGDHEVYTDPKLLTFIFKQLLINCAKYCPGCQITVEIDESAIVLEDNGPGIPSHELPRVTERGFTGAKWRSEKGTGMGLYIVRKLCEQLSIKMEITSEEGKYTRFSFYI